MVMQIKLIVVVVVDSLAPPGRTIFSLGFVNSGNTKNYTAVQLNFKLLPQLGGRGGGGSCTSTDICNFLY